MKKIFQLFLFFILSLSSSVYTTEIEEERGFNIFYDVLRDGMKVAKMQRFLSEGIDENILFSETKTTGIISLFRRDKIVEKSTWKTIDGEFVPKLYEYQRTGTKNDRNVSVEFNWKNNQIINSVDGSSWKMPTINGIVDKLLYQYLIMLDLNKGKETLSYLIADGGKEKVYLFETIGEELIETPLGELQTIKLKRQHQESGRESISWHAPLMNYLPVKLEVTSGDNATTVLIKSVSSFNLEPSQELVVR